MMICSKPAFCDRLRIQMAKNQVLSFHGRHFEFACLSGLLWLTDGVKGDRIIESGQQATVDSKRKICIQAFEPSVIEVQQLSPVKHAEPQLQLAVAG